MIWFTLLLLISAKANEVCEKKIGKITELACSEEPLDIGTAEIKLSEEAKGLKEKRRKANIEEMLRAFKNKIRSLKKPLNKNADFLSVLSVAEQEIKKGVSPSKLLYLRPSDSFLDRDKAALEACIRTKKEDRNIGDYDLCANLLAQVLTERAHGKLFSENYYYGDMQLEVELRETSLYKEVLKSQRDSIISENNKIYEKFDETIEATLVDVKKTMKDFISKPSIIQNEEVRKKMQEKIGRIEFKGSSCLSKGSDAIAPLFMKGAFYNPRTETFIYCRGMVDGRRLSEYQLVHVISHELAHSIDPCKIQFKSESNPAIINYEGSDNLEKTYPFSIIGCLRSKDSIQAFNPNHPHAYKTPFCYSSDQIGESFCDWLAAEILSRHMNSNSRLSGNDKNQHINGIASAFRFLCDPRDGLGTSGLDQENYSGYPMPIDRLERIFLAHPGIRRKLCGKNVKSKVRYCDPTTKPTNRSGDSGQNKSSSSIQ